MDVKTMDAGYLYAAIRWQTMEEAWVTDTACEINIREDNIIRIIMNTNFNTTKASHHVFFSRMLEKLGHYHVANITIRRYNIRFKNLLITNFVIRSSLTLFLKNDTKKTTPSIN